MILWLSGFLMTLANYQMDDAHKRYSMAAWCTGGFIGIVTLSRCLIYCLLKALRGEARVHLYAMSNRHIRLVK